MKKQLKVIHFISSLQGGGMEYFVIRLAYAQKEMGYDVKIVSIHGGPLLDIAKKMDLEVLLLESTSVIGRIFSLVQKLIFKSIDIVHVHNPTTLQYGVVAKLVSSAKLIFTDHAQTRGIARMPNPNEWKFVNGVVAVSKATSKKTHLLGYNGDVEVIYNGINPLQYSKERNAMRKSLGLKDEITLINIAGLLPVKGQDILIEALHLLGKENLNFRLFIVGKGSEEKKLKELAKKLGLLGRRVEFLGFRTDTADLLNASDVFVLPSRNEGLPISILEAMSLKLPVIVSDVGGNAELVKNNIHGFVFEKENIKMLADKIKEIILDEPIRKKMGLDGYEHVSKNYSFDDMVKKYSDVYLNCLD